MLRVDSKSVWVPCGPQGSPAPRWEAAVDLAGAVEKVWMWEALEETVRLALDVMIGGILYCAGSFWEMIAGG